MNLFNKNGIHGKYPENGAYGDHWFSFMQRGHRSGDL